MSEGKNYPTHRISFAEVTRDANGREQLGKPVEVATVWPRKDPKKSGGIIKWHIQPQALSPEGVFFQLDTERTRNQGMRQGFEQVEYRATERGPGRGR